MGGLNGGLIHVEDGGTGGVGGEGEEGECLTEGLVSGRMRARFPWAPPRAGRRMGPTSADFSDCKCNPTSPKTSVGD